jgi:hypothetical protein
MTEKRKNDGPRIRKEKETVGNMIHYYCKKKHTSNESLCEDCTQLLDYSNQRLDRCRYGEDKPTCRKCSVHCYKFDMRDQIRSAMRYSGPRLIFRAPLTWLRHIFHERE